MWGAAFFTYAATIVIAYLCAGMIFVMVTLLEKFSKKKNESVQEMRP
jgi:hypothetical protein